MEGTLADRDGPLYGYHRRGLAHQRAGWSDRWKRRTRVNYWKLQTMYFDQVMGRRGQHADWSTPVG